MDVIVIVDVIAPVMVAALVSGNDTVGVIDKPWTPKIDQFHKHRHGAFDQLEPTHVVLRVGRLLYSHDVAV